MSRLETMERYLRAQMPRARKPAPGAPPVTHPFITISRQAGAGGHALANSLLEVFSRQEDSDLFAGWQIFDHRICEMVADDPTYSASLESLLAEEYRTRTHEFFSQHLRSTLDQDAVMFRVFTVIRAVASLGKSIILGRAGSEVTRDMGPGISVRLVAPESVCVQGVMSLYGLGERAARQEARRLDTARARLLKTHFGVDITDPLLYDVVFNAGRMSMDDIAEALAVMVRHRAEVELEATRV